MKFIMVIMAAAAMVLGANRAFSDEIKHITLEAKNTVSLREEFTSGTVNTLKGKLIQVDQNLGPKEEIYLYLDSPGGEILAGTKLIEVIRGLRHKVNVVANFAASMAYLTTQAATGKRYITTTGSLMAHRAYLGAEGFSPGNFETRAAYYHTIIGGLSAMAATRTGITAEDYETKVREEYWVVGAKAVADKQADEVVTASCSSDLNGVSTETLYTMFGPVGIVWANCPLVSEPLGLDFSGVRADISNQAKIDEFENVIMQSLMHKNELVHNAVLEQNFLNYVK